MKQVLEFIYNINPNEAETLLGNLATAASCVAHNAPSLKAAMGAQGLVKTLSDDIPLWFITDRRKHIILPFLLSLCYNDENNMNIMKESLSSDTLKDYIEKMNNQLVNWETLELHEPKKEDNISTRRLLCSVSLRFPVYLWDNVLKDL